MKKVILLALIVLSEMPMYSQSQKKTVIMRNDAGIVCKANFSLIDPEVETPASASDFFETYLNINHNDSFVKHVPKSHDKETSHEYNNSTKV